MCTPTCFQPCKVCSWLHACHDMHPLFFSLHPCFCYITGCYCHNGYTHLPNSILLATWACAFVNTPFCIARVFRVSRLMRCVRSATRAAADHSTIETRIYVETFGLMVAPRGAWGLCPMPHAGGRRIEPGFGRMSFCSAKPQHTPGQHQQGKAYAEKLQLVCMHICVSG